jgi:hypothetical protein
MIPGDAAAYGLEWNPVMDAQGVWPQMKLSKSGKEGCLSYQVGPSPLNNRFISGFAQALHCWVCSGRHYNAGFAQALHCRVCTGRHYTAGFAHAVHCCVCTGSTHCMPGLHRHYTAGMHLAATPDILGRYI